MKIRADFVTNSSSSSYVDIYADNPLLDELLKKHQARDAAYYCYQTDWCDEHEVLDYPSSLAGYLDMIAAAANIPELTEKREEILRGFRMAKYNTGYHYTEGYWSGEEHHISISSRWGVLDQCVQTEEDEGWECVKTEERERPYEPAADFTGARPEDLEAETDVDDKIRYLLDHISHAPVELSGKRFVFMGDYDHCQSLSADEDEDAEYEDEESWGDASFDDGVSYEVMGLLSEIDMISHWLPQESTIESISDTDIDEETDCLVVRLDSWARKCIDPVEIEKAVELGIPIVSEFQFWKALFA